MNSRLCLATLFAMLVSLTPAVHAKELLQQFSGSVSADTPEFDVVAPWIVEWRITGEPNPGAGVRISMIKADSGAEAGLVLNTTKASESAKLFKQSGRYYFHVDANKMNWALRVTQVSQEEAKQYEKPAKENPYR